MPPDIQLFSQNSISSARSLEVDSRSTIERRPWNVLQVRSNFEKRVAQHLAIRSVEHYLPLYRERVRWSDRTTVAERPLFSGYVFVRFSPEARITVISTPGVVRSLGDSESSLVSCEELEKIRSGLASGLLLRPHPNVVVGTKVRIRRGVFEGLEGIVTEFRQQCKVVISLAAVRQSFSNVMDLDDIEIVKAPAQAASVIPTRRDWKTVGAFGV